MTRWEVLTRRMARNSVKTFKVDEYVIYHYCENQQVISTCKVCAVFDSDHSSVDVGGSAMIDTHEYYMLIEKYVLTRKPKTGDLVTRRNLAYRVVGIEEDGHASYRLKLHADDDLNAQQHYERI
jgi:hypothetical protein